MAHTGPDKSFFGAFKETIVAYLFDLCGLIAGFVVASQLGVFELAPWAIALYPAIVSAKGVINGVLSGRLGTGLHLGTIRPRFSENTQSFYKLFSALIVMTLATAVTMGSVSLVFGSLFWGITAADFPAIVSVVVATMSIGLILTVLTTKVAFISFKKGLDPDIVVYPIMSTVADIFVTLCYVLILNLFFFADAGKWIIALIVVSHLILVLYIIPRNWHSKEFLKTIKESLGTMILVAFIVNVTGTILKEISAVVESRREIYTVYPALIDLVGDVGSVIGSTATTKLALGLLKPSFASIRNHSRTILSSWTASIIMFLVLAVLSLILNGVFSLSASASLILLLLVTNIISVSTILMVSFGVSILTFKRGLDPDNFVIPIESTLADSVTSLALLVALLLFG
jgi:mgtE-like transporter